MEDITIRHIVDFSPGLVRDLCKLEIENLGEEASVNQWVIPVLIRHGLVTIAEKQPDREIAGVCQVIRSYREPSQAFIHSFYIRPHLRGRHIGRMLLEEVLEKIRSDDFKRIRLTVDPENTAAVALYDSAGFKRSSVLRDEYGEGVDRVLYTLEL
jgi:ribosomal protein S18 acetylase RimI-like enzyme